jgi:DNA-3-methyladenine glycosylase I
VALEEGGGQRVEGRAPHGTRPDAEAVPENARSTLRPRPSTLARCAWPKSELDIAYHDTEWGVPVHDDPVLFEFLTLEGAQAGLSWSTILKKREHYRRAFEQFDPQRVARFTSKRIERLLADPGIVRHRGKIESTVSNAVCFIDVQREFGSFDRYVWQFVGGAPRLNNRRTLRDVPPRTPESDALSKDLKRRGFRFVGSTICYAFMQAVGMVNDHTTDCFRYAEISAAFYRATSPVDNACGTR